ncbi:hypothetical protein GE061_002327 [Apolygus lucorum]|uniref:Uncharacterized protein n=1 Tax=Apolygus lucorum TaxID=248454 RepID=A0A8S9X6I9_APOLU|nr:hypothetical protein GE061_002327 [Apolygus lucorum]
MEGTLFTIPVSSSRFRGIGAIVSSTITNYDRNTEKFTGEGWDDEDESTGTVLTKELTHYHRQGRGHAPPRLRDYDEIFNEPDGMECEPNDDYDEGTRPIELVRLRPDDPTLDDSKAVRIDPTEVEHPNENNEERDRKMSVAGGRESAAIVNWCVKERELTALEAETPVTAGTQTTTLRAGEELETKEVSNACCLQPYPLHG